MIDCVMYVYIFSRMNGYYVNEWLRDDEKFWCCIYILYFEIYIYILEEGWIVVVIFGL